MAFVVFHWSGAAPAPAQAAIDKRALGAGLVLVARSDRWAAFASRDQEVLVLPQQRGVVFGAMFTRQDRPVRIAGDDAAKLDRLARHSRESMVHAYWGRYVALLDEGAGTLAVCRDPSGSLACFHAIRGPLDLLASDVALVVDLGLVPSEIDWGYVAHHIAYAGSRVARTGIVGVEEVLPGDCLILSGTGKTRSAYWRPAQFIDAALQLRDATEAAHLLYAEIERSVTALVCGVDAIVLELSGGLDSSIVAMALRGRANTFAVNVTTPGSEGDERRYARQVAAAAGLPLTELTLTPSGIDFRKAPAARLARPGRSTVLQTVDAAFMGQGVAHKASAFFNGTGGDSVFCYVTSAAPAADRLRAEGPSLGVLSTLLDIAALTGSTAWTVGRLALKIALRRDNAPTLRSSLEHLSPAYRPLQPDRRPWTEGLEAAPPGRRRHVEAILGIHGHIDGLDRNQVAPVIAPHGAQPVLELVLRIPTWMWVEGGRDRSVARQAYSQLLPPDVFNRRSKGRINHFIVEAYEANRPLIGQLLDEGLLARHGVIDRGAVRRTLEGPVEMDQANFMSVIRLLDAELWARTWSGGEL